MYRIETTALSSTCIGSFSNCADASLSCRQSSPDKSPLRNLLTSTSHSESKSRSDRLTCDISSEKMHTGVPFSAADLAKCSIKAVLPIAGRAARIINCDPLQPPVSRFKSEIPVGMPVGDPPKYAACRCSASFKDSVRLSRRDCPSELPQESAFILSISLFDSSSTSATSFVSSPASVEILEPAYISKRAI